MYRLFLLLFLPGFLFTEIYVDVRTPNEFQEESIINTINIEWQKIQEIKGVAAKDEDIYLFCRSGNRSEKAKAILEEAGYKKVKNIGGFKEAQAFIKARSNINEN